MKNICTFFLLIIWGFIFTPITSIAQNFGNPPAWKHIHQAGGSGADKAVAVAHDNASNAYYTGVYNGQIKLGATTFQSTGQNEGFLAKVAADGSILWAKQFKASTNTDNAETICTDVAVDLAGDIVVCGYFTRGDLKIGNNAKVLQGISDFFVVKYDPNGNVKFVFTDGTPGVDFRALKLEIDDSNQIYCLTNLYTVKIDASGNLDWVRSHPQGLRSGDLSWNNGHLYLAFTFGYYTQIDNIDFTAQGDGAILCEMDLTFGNQTNGRLLAEALVLSLNSLLVATPDAFYLTGYFQQTITCGAYSASLTNFSTQAFIAKFNATDCTWLQAQSNEQTLGSNAYGVQPDGLGGLWVGGECSPGFTWGGLNLNAGTGFLAKINDATGSVAAISPTSPILSLSASGNEVWKSGYNNFSAVYSKNGPLGPVFEKVPENDGGLFRIASLESDDSGVYLSATVSGKFTFLGQAFETPGPSLFIAKLNLKTDQILWHKIIEGPVAAIRTFGNDGCLDPQTHRFYMVASFPAPFTYNGQTINEPDPNAPSTFCVIQTNADGSAGWLRVLPGANYVNGLAVDHQHNIIIGGTFENQAFIGNTTLVSKGMSDFFVTKMDENGNAIWTKRGGGDDIEYSATPTVDAQNNIYITSESYSLSFEWNDEWTMNSQIGDGNLFLLKIAPNGNVIWGKLNGGDGDTSGDGYESYCFQENTKTDASGNTYISGIFGPKNNLGSFSLTSNYSFNDFVAKFDPSGTALWVKPIYTKRLTATLSEIDIDENGDLYWACQIRDSTFIGNQLFLKQGTTNAARNFLLCRFSGADGSLIWAKQSSGTDDAIANPTGMAVYDSKSMFVSGYFTDRLSFDNTNLNNFSGIGSFLNLLGADVVLSVNSLSNGEKTLEIFPNPAVAESNIRVNNASLSDPYTIIINDSNGNLVKSVQCAGLSAAQKIPLTGLPAGVYFVTVKNDKSSETQRLLIN